MPPSGVRAAPAVSAVRPGLGVRSKGRGSVAGYGVPASPPSSTASSGARSADSARQRRPCRRARQIEGEQVRLGGTEVVVPEPHGVGLVQDRRDLLLLPQGPQLRLGLERLGGAGSSSARQHDPVGGLRDGRDRRDAAGEPGHRAASPPAAGSSQSWLDSSSSSASASGRAETNRMSPSAVNDALDSPFADRVRRVGEPPTVGRHRPERALVRGAVLLQCRHRQDRTPVGREAERLDARKGDVSSSEENGRCMPSTLTRGSAASASRAPAARTAASWSGIRRQGSAAARAAITSR